MKPVFALLLSCSGVCAQQYGTVRLVNIQWPYVNAPDYLCDSSTRLAGPKYTAEMLAGPLGSTNLVSVATTRFLSDPYAGYYLGPEVDLNYCGSALIQIRIWNTNAGTTFEAAQASGLTNAWAESAIFTVSPLGGYCCEPPCIPPPLIGLNSLRLNGPYSPPRLGITTVSAQNIQLDWPYGLGNFVVQESRDLQSSNWSRLAMTPTVYGSTNLITLSRPTNTTFFRLVSQ